MKYILVYAENCTPCTKQFSTLKELKTFISEWYKKYPDVDDYRDNWLDFVVKGNIVSTYEGYVGWRKND